MQKVVLDEVNRTFRPSQFLLNRNWVCSSLLYSGHRHINQKKFARHDHIVLFAMLVLFSTT